MHSIYLDYNATTPIAPSVFEAMRPFFVEHFGNPSSEHAVGRATHFAIEQAREDIALAISAEPEEIVFTASGTESNNLAIKGVVTRSAAGTDAHLVISAVEHPSVMATAKYLQQKGYRITVCPCDSDGIVHPEEVEKAIEDRTVLVSVMHANNETGAIQPISKIAAVCRRRGIPIHTDAAQSFGKYPTDVQTLGVDLLTIVGHKIYAPKGIGALYVRRGLAIDSLLHGASHEYGMRAGTENVPYIVGLAAACRMASRALDESCEQLSQLRGALQAALESAIDGAVVHARNAERLPNTLSIALPGVTAREILTRTPELAVSTGAACHSGEVGVSPTLAAMGVAESLAASTLRFSVGWQTSTQDIQTAAERITDAWEASR